ncbi:MAG: histidine kinase dimerization/phospho-acceptor domain-containing protein [Planctomycetota bacterium]
MSFVSSNPDCGSAAIREPIITESLDLHGFQSLLEAGRQIITATENQDVLANCLYFSKVLLGASEATLINSEEKNPDPASDLDWDCVQNSIEHKAAVIGKRDPQRRGVICCPIYASGILIAIIHVGPCQTHSTNGSSQRQILGYLASQSGAALEKNEAVRRLKDSNQLLEQQVDDRTRRIRERSESLERTAAALEIACDQANAASRAKSDFIANMSHEIRTPIAAIIGFTDLMLRDMIPEEEIREKLGAILSSGQHLLELVNDILDISKIEANRLELEFLPLNFHDLAEEVFESFRFQASDKDLEFRMELSPNLPEMIRSDPTRLRQVLNNLIGNAVKFTEKGTISIRIYSLPSENPEECHIAVEVIDSGIGISKCQLERIFEAFVQADSSTTRQYGGTGL